MSTFLNTMQNLSKNNSFLSIKEAAKALRVSTKTLRRWENKGKILLFLYLYCFFHSV